jgi:hypothetical protein
VSGTIICHMIISCLVEWYIVPPPLQESPRLWKLCVLTKLEPGYEASGDGNHFTLTARQVLEIVGSSIAFRRAVIILRTSCDVYLHGFVDNVHCRETSTCPPAVAPKYTSILSAAISTRTRICSSRCHVITVSCPEHLGTKVPRYNTMYNRSLNLTPAMSTSRRCSALYVPRRLLADY